MYYLKKYVKYRKEKDYILICDCSVIQNYELPLSAFALFQKLENGYDPKNPIGVDLEQDIFNDLKNLELLDVVPNSNVGFHEQEWIDLGYSENEFF